MQNSQEILRKNEEIAKSCRSQVEAAFNDLLQSVNRHKAQMMQFMDETLEKMHEEIDGSIKETVEKAYFPEYKMQKSLAYILWTHSLEDSSEPIVLFDSQVEKRPVDITARTFRLTTNSEVKEGERLMNAVVNYTMCIPEAAAPKISQKSKEVPPKSGTSVPITPHSQTWEADIDLPVPPHECPKYSD